MTSHESSPYSIASSPAPFTTYVVFVDLIRVPDWAFEAAGQEMRGMGQDTAAYQPGIYLMTTAQRQAMEAVIQELPKFTLKTVPVDCCECPICLEEFHVGNEVAEVHGQFVEEPQDLFERHKARVSYADMQLKVL